MHETADQGKADNIGSVHILDTAAHLITLLEMVDWDQKLLGINWSIFKAPICFIFKINDKNIKEMLLFISLHSFFSVSICMYYRRINIGINIVQVMLFEMYSQASLPNMVIRSNSIHHQSPLKRFFCLGRTVLDWSKFLKMYHVP